jgi:pimeloyl-ACP methyl ester carboxylesterase
MQPHTDTQRVLAGIWQELLQLEAIGIDDGFFDVGGTSLLTLQVYDKVRSHYGREFPLFDFSVAPTIRTLAELMDRELAGHETCEYRSLKRVRKGEDGQVPLFLVHGGDGNARVFQRLARHLDPRIPVYAFQWTGWDGQRGDKTFRAMAQTYKKEMLHRFPAGPYRLGGYCIGGLVALEMANLLKEEGHELQGPVFIWDSSNVASESYHLKEPWYSSKAYFAFKRMADKLNGLRQETMADCAPLTLPSQFTGSYEVLRRYPGLYSFARNAQVRIGLLLVVDWRPSRNPVPIKWRWSYCMATCYLALWRHTAKPYSGNVVFFRSDVFLGRTMNLPGWWDDPFMGFPELCKGSFKGYAVGGGHVDVLDAPFGAKMVNQTYFGDAE